MNQIGSHHPWIVYQKVIFSCFSCQIRTKMVAPGGEALGGIIGISGLMVQTEGFFSLYKGLMPAIVAMAPSGAVFYGVYDILKSLICIHLRGGRDSYI